MSEKEAAFNELKAVAEDVSNMNHQLFAAGNSLLILLQEIKIANDHVEDVLIATKPHLLDEALTKIIKKVNFPHFDAASCYQ